MQEFGIKYQCIKHIGPCKDVSTLIATTLIAVLMDNCECDGINKHIARYCNLNRLVKSANKTEWCIKCRYSFPVVRLCDYSFYRVLKFKDGQWSTSHTDECICQYLSIPGPHRTCYNLYFEAYLHGVCEPCYVKYMLHSMFHLEDC